MRYFAALMVLLAGLQLPAAEKRPRWHALWRVSQTVLAGAESADAITSWGKLEANPLMRAGPRFSYGSLAIKFGAVTAGLLAQHVIVHRRPQSAAALAATNFAAAGALAAVASHNASIPK